MATLKAVVVPAKALKGGKHKIRIAVSHNGEVRYIVTDITIDSEKEFRSGQIVKRSDAAILNTKLRGWLQKSQEAIDGIEYTNGLTCSELVELIKQGKTQTHHTLKTLYDEYISLKTISSNTARQYDIAFRKITSFLNENSYIENYAPSTVLSLFANLKSSGLGNASVHHYMTLFRSLLHYAEKAGYVRYKRDLFLGISFPRPEIRDSWLSVDQVKAIRDCKPQRKSVRLCRDLFMLSYYLGGINMADLARINFAELGTSIKYERKKTENRQKPNKYVEFEMPAEAISLIAEMIGKDGRIAMSSNRENTLCRDLFSYNMKLLAKEAGVPQIIYYSARKSFAQHAFNLGVSEGVVDYILGHKVGRGGSSLYNYISVTPKMASEAVRKVLDNLK